ncbi:stage III sporulation protein AF [Anaerobacillus alkalidiazotrophicus]|uniref:Stage III sporulation protein AF n=1 Tax=Anaerobacillus alkalidiazotrophicus TaxID=472963 RepID=A0A1S2M699_9BACI|nr:stage III sporulation protein AF [Anaerobacillus alkalidiazotrophicus]OIJ20302.1 stage III sporulation protein AF [Anaerobacillus alkalidiazotrophicus]
MQFLTEWISNIILLILLATILELLLPNSSLQRYVKMVVGLLLLVIILNPLFTIFTREADSWVSSIGISSQFNEKNLEISIENKKKEIESAQLAYISEQVAVQLKRQVEEEMIDKFEKEIKSISVNLTNFLDEEDYLNSVAEVLVELKAVNGDQILEEKGSIEVVSLVAIDTSKQLVTSEKGETNKQEIINYLGTQWPIPLEKIEVVMEGGS